MKHPATLAFSTPLGARGDCLCRCAGNQPVLFPGKSLHEFEVDASWRDGGLAETVIKSKLGGPCVVCYRDKMTTIDTHAGRVFRLNGALESTSTQ